MEYFDFLFLVFTETVKYFLINYGIIGMKLKENYKKYIPVLISFIAAMTVIYAVAAKPFYIRIFYNFTILLMFFDERFVKKIEYFIMEYIAVNAVDIFLWSIFAIFIDVNIKLEVYITVNVLSELLGCIFWYIIFMVLKRKREGVYRGVKSIPTGYFIVFFIFLTALCLMIGGTHTYVVGRMTDRLWRYFLIIGSAVLILFVVVGFIFLYIAYSKKQLEKEKQFRDKYIVLQKEYYERMIEDDKKIRGFRHDVAKHIQVMNAMCADDEVDALKDYIAGLSGRYIEETIKIHTGNLAADYFINSTIAELKSYGKINYEVMGRIPDNIGISNLDISILFGNALDNAKEALSKVNGERVLKVSIMNYQSRLFLNISNSVSDEANINLKTTKADAAHHGYGIRNMRDVVARYGGSIDFKIEDGMFVVDIEV